MAMGNDSDKGLDPRGLDVHGAEPISHRFTITDADGNADVELNFSLPLTRKRHALLEHLLEEGYSEHEAYVLIAGGEIMAHIQAIRDKKAKS
jgi:ribosomal silencing factor RsfS